MELEYTLKPAAATREKRWEHPMGPIQSTSCFYSRGFFSPFFFCQDRIYGFVDFLSFWEIWGLSFRKILEFLENFPFFRQKWRFLAWNLSFWSKFAQNLPLFGGFLSFRGKNSLSFWEIFLEFEFFRPWVFGQMAKKNPVLQIYEVCWQQLWW